MNDEQFKRCPECGRWMIRRFTGMAILTWPVLRETYWWCGCGHTETAEEVPNEDEDDVAMADWLMVNDGPV